MHALHGLILCIPMVLGVHTDPKHPDRCYNQYHERTWADGVEMPDKKYDHQPKVPYYVELVTKQQMVELCGKNADACTVPMPDLCVTYVQRTYDDGSSQEHILRHERAHCNGWNHRNQ